MKKIIYKAIIFFVLITTAISTINTAFANSPSLTVSSKTINAGETFDVNVTLNNIAQISGIQFYLSYDKDKFTIEKNDIVLSLSLKESLGIEFTFENGIIKLLGAKISNINLQAPINVISFKMTAKQDAPSATYLLKLTEAYINTIEQGAGGKKANQIVPTIENGSIIIKGQEQSAPTGLLAVAPTTAFNNNGKITGTTTDMEYKLSTDNSYKAVTGTEITGLSPGDYLVRYKAKQGINASPDTNVKIVGYVAPPTNGGLPQTSTPGTNQTKKLFSDVSGWAEGFVYYLAEKNIIKGKAEGIFAPNDNVTRAEFVAIIARALGVNTNNLAYKNDFSDVKQSDWFSLYVSWAKERKIINGYEDGSFAPNKQITREELCTMIVRALSQSKIEISSFDLTFADSNNISDWAKNSVAYLAKMAIVSGKGNNYFAPKDFATRAETAKIIYGILLILN